MRRWLAGVAIAAVAGGAYLALRGDDDADPRPTAEAPDRARPTASSRRAAPPTRDAGGRKITYLEPGPGDPSPGVKKWKVEGLPGTFREEMAPDDSVNLEEKLTYKQRRLRFRLSDAAADCYSGEDSKEQMTLSYSMVVKDKMLTVENLRVLQSNLSDASVQQCIVAAVQSVRSPTDLPDSKKDIKSTISLHDLWVRNRSVD